MKRTALARSEPPKRKAALRRTRFERRLTVQQAVLDFSSAVLARAAGRCERCKRKAPLDAHHICPRSRAPKHPMLHSPSNGAALCRPCHREVHERIDPWREWLRSDPLEALP